MELTKEYIVNLLATNDTAVAKALAVIHSNQTKDEQKRGDVQHSNGVGFRPCDARMGTAMAAFYEKNGYLTPRQTAYWRRTDKNGTMKIAVYWRQLVEAANKRAAA